MQYAKLQTICTSLQTDYHTNTSSLNFIDALQQPGELSQLLVMVTAPKHCRG